MTTERLFKVLGEDGKPFHGGTGHWSLPTDEGPGEWMPSIEGALVPCENGYHLCRIGDLLDWLGPTIYEAECRGDRIDAGNKVVVREARLLRRLNWDDHVARLFACDCAEDVLPLFERDHPDDYRPRRAIEVARQYANGAATADELAAASDAAWAAAMAAASDAAWAAAWAAARAAAMAAASDAARAAAMAAASDAAWDRQAQRLLAYLDGAGE